MKLVSACLLGINCKYDCGNNYNKKVARLASKEVLIPVCPEQLAGLPTPRRKAEIVNNKVFTMAGMDVTEKFKFGAEQVLKLAELFNIKEAVFKQRSPSCGSGLVYDGTFSGKVVKGDGITTRLLKENGIKVISEEEL